MDKLNTTYDIHERAMQINPNGEEYNKILEELAKQGKFDTHTTKFNTKNMLPTDGNYVYRPKNFGFKILKFFVKSVLFLFRPIVNFFAFGIKVEGRENLKGLKSAITISNHVHYIDILLIMQALRKNKLYIVTASHNMKKGRQE